MNEIIGIELPHNLNKPQLSVVGEASRNSSEISES